MTERRLKYLSVVLVALTLVCLSLGIFCGQLVGTRIVMLGRRLLLLGSGVGAVGGVALIVRAIRTAWRIAHLLNSSEVAFPDAVRSRLHKIGFDQQHIVLIASLEPRAFCYGFLKPRICLSTGLVDRLSPVQLRAVLLHEDHHREHFHPLRILLLEALAAAFFFLPIVGDWCKLQKIKLELDADQYAVEQVGKPALAGALHRLLTDPTAPVPGAVVGLSVSQARVARLLGEREPSPFANRNLVISAAVLLGLCMVLL